MLLSQAFDLLCGMGSSSKRQSIAIMVSLLVLLVIDQVYRKERPCSLHRALAEADVCDGVYQLVFLSHEVLSNETWRDTVPSSVYQENVLAVDGY